MICVDMHQVPSARVRIIAWMAGASPAVAQAIEFKKRSSWPKLSLSVTVIGLA
jgi:hypothetical protein